MSVAVSRYIPVERLPMLKCGSFFSRTHKWFPSLFLSLLIQVTLLVDVPVIGRITIPLEKRGEIPIPHKPDVDLDSIDWDHLSLESTSATLHLSLKNMNKFDIGNLTHCQPFLPLLFSLFSFQIHKCVSLHQRPQLRIK